MFLRRFTFILFLILPFQIAFAKQIKIGIIAGPSVEIFNMVQKISKEKYNLDVKPIIFTDYIMPNEALNSDDLDLNIFQTQAFLDESILKRNYKLSVIGKTFIYPMGIYSKKINKLTELKEKAIIAIPNDLSNEARALLLMNTAGLIKIKVNHGNFIGLNDITENSKNLKIMTLDAGQLARVTPDVDALILNNDFVHNAGFKVSDALIQENPKTAIPYINIIVAQTAKKDNPDFQKIIEIIHSKEVVDKSMELYPSAVKAW